MSEDIRVIRTKNTIKDTLVRILKIKPLSSISVTEICRYADINRTTFYKYYNSPQDLLNKLEQDHLDELQAKMIHAKATSFKDALKMLLTELNTNHQFYETLFSENGDLGFRNRILNLCYQTNIQAIQSCYPTLVQWQRDALYYFIAEGCNGILQHWLINGNAQNPEELASYIVKLVESINPVD